MGGTTVEKSEDENSKSRLQRFNESFNKGKGEEEKLSKKINLPHLDSKARELSPSAERRFKVEEYAGARGLRIELEFEASDKRENYVNKYLGLLDSVAGILKAEGITGHDTKTGKDIYAGFTDKEKIQLQEDFIKGIWKAMEKLKIKFGDDKPELMHQSMDKVLLHYYTSMLAFDVAKELGIPAARVSEVPNHAFFKTDDFFFEITSKGLEYNPVKKLAEIYPFHTVSSKLEVIDADAYNARGNANFGKKEYDEAIRDYGRAIELDPKFIHGYLNRALAHCQKKEYDEAIRDSNKAIRLNPRDSQGYHIRGFIYSAKGKYTRAIEEYSEATSLDPKNELAFIDRGVARTHKKQYEWARWDFNIAIELNPKNAEAYVGKADNYYLQGAYDLAIKDYSKAIELDPNNAVVYTLRGISYAKKKDYESALRDYDKAIELEPKNSGLHVEKGVIYLAMRDYNRAIQELNKAIGMDPNNADAYETRGSCYVKLRDYDKAIQDYDKAIELDPEHKNARRGREYAYAKKERRGLSGRSLDIDIKRNINM
jgi:tetratricopeptide (TPR) repeat protein